MALTAYEFIQLKEKIKNELARRNACGPVNQYASSDYKFQTIPEAGGVILAEQGQKVLDIALTVTDIDGIKSVQEGDYIPTAVDTLGDLIDTWSNQDMRGNSTSCRGACTGLCYNSCSTTCGGCGNDCGKSCGEACMGCSNSCAGNCGNTCTDSCGGSCTGQCYGSCTGGCRTACNGCTGCTGCSGGSNAD